MSLLDKADLSEQTAHGGRTETGTEARRLRREAQFTVKIDGVFVRKQDGRTASIARAALQQTPGA